MDVPCSLDVHAEKPELEPTPLDTEPTEDPGWPADRLAVAGDELAAADSVTRVEPVSASQRYFSVDVIRGFALLGILAMNIVGFGWPGAAYGNPFRGAGFDGLDRVVWFFNHMFFEVKMMTIFSMLFGAGLVLMDQRAEQRGAKIRGVYYRRILWLLVIGLIHAYLIWWGDILVLYAECGLFLYFFRNLRPRTLIIAGLRRHVVARALDPWLCRRLRFHAGQRRRGMRLRSRPANGRRPRASTTCCTISGPSISDEVVEPNPEKQAKEWNEEMAAYRGGYVGIVKHRAPELIKEHTFGFILGGGFFAMSRMLIGMGLMKLGVFSARRSRKFYWWMVGLGYGIGLPLMIFDALKMIQNRFSFDYEVMHYGVLYNLFGSLVVALGHVGMLALIVQSGALELAHPPAGSRRPDGPFQLPDALDRVHDACFTATASSASARSTAPGLAAIVLAIWIFQLVVSPIWLKYFRFGPAEWLWRSLTYWRIQPILTRPEQTQPAAA